jgi:hypothetical protein
MKILKLLPGEEFIHALWACHLVVPIGSTTFMITTYKDQKLLFSYQSLMQNQCFKNYP